MNVGPVVMVPSILPSVAASLALPAGPARVRAGFTLIELLVSMAVGLLLVVFLFQLFSSTVTAWRAGENQNDTYREARAAMQLMERDISQVTAALPRNAYSPSPAPSATPGIAPVLVLDRYPMPDPPMQSGDQINEELYCMTNIPNNGVSSLSAVGYFCMWMPDLVPTSDPQYAQKYASAPHAYALVRQYLGSGGYPAVSPTPAAAASTPVPGLFERLSAISPGKSPLEFSDIYARARPPLVPSPAPSPPLAIGTQLASYVWDLQFRTSDRLQVTSATPPPAYPANASTPVPYPTALPAYVEVRFKALSAGAGRVLEGNAVVQRTDWDDSKGGDAIYQRLILPGARQFVARVPIGSGSLNPTPSP